MPPLREWPMSHLVMLHGIALSLWTGARVVTSTAHMVGEMFIPAWTPSDGWLLYLTAALTATFATKRVTHEGLWKKTPPPPATEPPQ